jgi:energy-coupling factor transporter ATP-binding protein EcfA2
MLPARRDPEIPGDLLLDTVAQYVNTYAKMTPEALDVVTLWIAHTYMRDANQTLVFETSPRLYLLSSEPGSGKSTVLKLLNLLCPNTFGLDIEPTQPGLVFTINKEHATVLLDEGDILFGSGGRKSSVRAVINQGYTRDGSILNGIGGKPNRTNVFGPVAIAALDKVQTGTDGNLDALLSRGFIVHMAKATEPPQRFGRLAREQAAALVPWIAMWAAQVRDKLPEEPEIPEGLKNRPEEIAIPLLSIAQSAGERWMGRGQQAIEGVLLNRPRVLENPTVALNNILGSLAIA